MCHIVNSPKVNRFGVVVDGPVACGKGCQSRLIISSVGGVHISTGELARKKRQMCVEWNDKYGHILDAGQYLPDKVVFELVREFIPSVAEEKGVIIGDGLVRTRYQADQIGTIFARPQLMIGFSILIPKDVAIERALSRAKAEGRFEDFDERIISGRYDKWAQHKDSVHKKLRAKGIHLINVDGDRSVEAVSDTINHHLRAHLERQKRQWDESRSFSQPKRRKSRI